MYLEGDFFLGGGVEIFLTYCVLKYSGEGRSYTPSTPRIIYGKLTLIGNNKSI